MTIVLGPEAANDVLNGSEDICIQNDPKNRENNYSFSDMFDQICETVTIIIFIQINGIFMVCYVIVSNKEKNNNVSSFSKFYIYDPTKKLKNIQDEVLVKIQQFFYHITHHNNVEKVEVDRRSVFPSSKVKKSHL